jgi:cell division protein FtsQ
VREQVINHKVGNRSGIAGQRRSGAATQRPAARESEGEGLGARLRALLGFVPVFLKLVMAVVIGILFFAGYRVAASASFFQVRKVQVQGTSRTSAEDIQAMVLKDVEKTGVWKANLEGLSTRLEHLPWVRTAIVSRVLPDEIRVRIAEREPRAVVRTASGRFRWIDDDAVLLGEMLPTDQIPSFFLRGLNEEDSETARAENRERVQKFLELQRDWDAAGLSERVSEVNLIDIRDIRAQLAGDSSQIEVRLGSQDHGKRLKVALEVLDAQRQTPRGSLISYIDLSQGKRAIVGLISGAHTTNDSSEPPAPAALPSTDPTPVAPPEDKKPERGPAVTGARGRANTESNSRTVQSKTRKQRDDKKSNSNKKADKPKNSTRRTQ